MNNLISVNSRLISLAAIIIINSVITLPSYAHYPDNHERYQDRDQDQYNGHMMGMGMGMGNMGYHNMMGKGHMGMGMMGLYMLDLSDAQKKSIREIQKETRGQQFSFHDQLTEHVDKLHSLYREDKPDAKKIGNIYKNIFELKRQKIELGITTRNKIYDALTKEQKNKLKEWKSNMRYPQDRGGRGMMHNMMQ